MDDPKVMTERRAMDVIRQVEHILTENNIHYELSFVKKPDLRYINIREISIKIARA